LSRARGPLLVRLVRSVYVAFELTAFAALAVAAILAFYDLAVFIARHGFVYSEVLAKILLIFVFIDLMRVIVHSIAERRFRMDILFEALTIAIARDLISSLAMVERGLAETKILTLAGLLALVVGLWYFARRLEATLSPPRGRAPGEGG
jgi:uncharacterized membrane protein (DUF373 family)